MKILETKILKGPNIWSIKRKNLIVIKLDLEDYEDKPSNLIPGFAEKLKGKLPSLYTHRCSEGREGGFFERLEAGTWMGHIMEHVALEVQTLAGMDCGFGRTRSTHEVGIYNVAFSYLIEEAGLYAAEASFNFLNALAEGNDYDIVADIDRLKEIFESKKIGPSTEAILREAEIAQIPFIRLNDDSYFQLGYGSKQKRIEATITSQTSAIAMDIAADKEVTKQILQKAGIPVPSGITLTLESELEKALENLTFPLVTKPLNGNHGKGATTNINSKEDFIEGFRKAKQVSDKVIVERFIQGNDYRLLVINYKLVAASKREPAKITGDGVSTIDQLVREINLHPERGEGHQKNLTKIAMDDHTKGILKKKDYTNETILRSGEVLYLKHTANLSSGGTAEDVTEIICHDNVVMAERIARLIGLDVCGIDIISTDITRPLIENGAVLEVNAGPGFRMHTSPSIGNSRNPGKAVVDMLFPDPKDARIPVIAVTGTNGKTTTTRLLAHIARRNFKTVGYTTTDGVYINNDIIEEGDCTGPVSALKILTDPSVDFAVLECARGGLLRSGLAFDQCDVGVVTNVAEDHLGLNGIETIEEMARVKAVIAESVRKEGFAVLNADNKYTLQMGQDLDCNIAYFSLDPNHPDIINHCLAGGIAAVLENGNITVMDGMQKIRICDAQSVPLTFEGKAKFMVENILAAALAAYVSNISQTAICNALLSFYPSAATTPGRLNMFDFGRFRILVDYAHNPHGLKALKEFVDETHKGYKVGIVTGVGDRRSKDIREFGAIAGQLFDEIIIRLDQDTRGREEKEIIALIEEGISLNGHTHKIHIIREELEAINFAIKNAKENSLIVHLTEDIKNCLEIINEFLKVEKQFLDPEKILQKV